MVLFSRNRTKTKRGLYIRERKDGEYGIYHNDYIDELVVLKTQKQAEEIKQKMERLLNWSIDEDLYYLIMTKDNGFYESLCPALSEAVDVYQSGGRHLVFYRNKQGKEMRGWMIAKGLSVHQNEKSKWEVYHMPMKRMLSFFDEKETALLCAEKMAPLVDWTNENVIDLFLQAPDFCEYLGKMKEAIMMGKPTPEMPLSVRYKIAFFSAHIEKGDFGRYANAIDKLSSLVGMNKIKETVIDMVYEVAGKEKKRRGDDSEKQNLHMVFSGPAGTGKTEMARIMSDIFGSLGYLEKGHLVEVRREDMVGQHIGETEQKTKELIEQAIGGTLFIDEAYALAGDKQDFGHLAITTLIKEMEDRRGEFAVILAGYQADMNTLINMNEGFKSRIKKTLNFYDYTPEQVTEIVFRLLTNKGYFLSDAVKKEIEKAVKNKSKNGTVEGNARTARNIYEEVSSKQSVRLAKENVPEHLKFVVEVEDVKRATGEIDSTADRKELEAIRKEAERKLNSLIGLSDLKKETQRILNTIMIDKMRYEHGLSSEKIRMHMMFYGPPGTGKTTVARIMGEFLKGAGVLSNGHFLEVSRGDLVAQYVGQTAPKVREVVSKAMGGILFFDEAYSLANGNGFEKEALDELIKEMENNAHDLVVIFAGYRDKMSELLALNEGLRSRVPYHFDFPHYSANELYEMAQMTMEKTYGLVMDEEAKEQMRRLIQSETDKNGGFIQGDGRWLRNQMEVVKINQSNRLVNEMDEVDAFKLRQVKKDDIHLS